MEPVPESDEALEQLSGVAPHLRSLLMSAATRAAEILPECVGVSVTLYERGTPFTVTVTPPGMAEVDAVQYLEGGPCVAAAVTQQEQRVSDVLDEEQWQEYGAAAAHHGVRSSLSLPIVGSEGVSGAMNFYGGTADAFVGREHELAQMFGVEVEHAVRNADLSFLTLAQARRLPETLQSEVTVAQAVGVFVARHGCTVGEAEQRLEQAAGLAGISTERLAAAVVAGVSDRIGGSG